MSKKVTRWLSVLAGLAMTACGVAPPPPPPPARFSFEPAEAADASCTDVDPDALVAKVVDTSVTAGRAVSCLPGMSNGQGYVALGTRNAIGHPDMAWSVKPLQGGASVGGFSGAAIETLLPQEDGWIGAGQTGFGNDPVTPQLSGWSSTGTLLHSTRIGTGFQGVPYYVAPAFASGAVVAFNDSDLDAGLFLGLKVQHFDPEAAPRSAAVNVVPDPAALVAAGVDAHGGTLVLFDGEPAGLPPGHMGGRWMEPCGTASTAVFDTGLAYTPFGSAGTLAPLHDGSLALQIDGQWVARFAHLSTCPADPAPAWLAARPDTRLVRIRHGKGYALIPKPGPVAECRQQIFLYSKTGRFCGSATFTVDDLPCTTKEINLGPDGTVVQLSPRPLCQDPSCSSYQCSYTWWPRLLGCHGSAGAGNCGRDALLDAPHGPVSRDSHR